MGLTSLRDEAAGASSLSPLARRPVPLRLPVTAGSIIPTRSCAGGGGGEGEQGFVPSPTSFLSLVFPTSSRAGVGGEGRAGVRPQPSALPLTARAPRARGQHPRGRHPRPAPARGWLRRVGAQPPRGVGRVPNRGPFIALSDREGVKGEPHPFPGLASSAAVTLGSTPPPPGKRREPKCTAIIAGYCFCNKCPNAKYSTA